MRKKSGTGKVLKNCFDCKKEFYARHDRVGLFCSYHCSSKNKKQMSYRIYKICDVCKKQFLIKRYRKESALYCSHECRRKRMPSKENHHNWKGGISKRPWRARKAIKIAKEIKKKCEKCGSKKNLQGHHILKYSERPDLCDDLNNIEIICADCHALEHPELENMILKPKKLSGIMVNCNECNNQYYIHQYKIGKSRWCNHHCRMNGLIKINKGSKRGKYATRKMDTERIKAI